MHRRHATPCLICTLLVLGACDALGDDIECADFDDQTAVQPVTVQLVNALDGPLFIGPARFGVCGEQPLFEVEQDDAEVPIPPTGTCRPTCEQERQAGDCGSACQVPPSFRIDPGGMLETSWSGLELVQRSVPSRCTHGQGNLVCQQVQVAQSGDYRIRARGFTEIVGCDGPFAFCDCVAGPQGSCELVDPGELHGVEHTAMTTVQLPHGGVAELVFE